MEEVKFISFFLIVVTVLSGAVMTFIDKRNDTQKEKTARKIYRENREE